MTTEYPIHPAADLFPMMTPEEYEALKEDIREHGQHEWATLLDGKIIDGRNRYRACRELGIETEFCELDVRDHPQPFDPVAFVLSKNLYRRHLTREQRDEVIKKLRSMGKTCQAIADAVGVNKATVSRVVANATTESPATVKGKDGKQYPAKKAKPPVAPVDPDQDPCRICGTFLPVADGMCQRCIDEGATGDDVAVVDDKCRTDSAPETVFDAPPDVPGLKIFSDISYQLTNYFCERGTKLATISADDASPMGKIIVAYDAMMKSLEQFQQLLYAEIKRVPKCDCCGWLQPDQLDGRGRCRKCKCKPTY
jgi:hypothetical protein